MGKKCQEKIATGKNRGLQKETHKWRSKWATQRDEVSRAASQQHSPDQSSVSTTQNPEWRIHCSTTLWINLKSTFHLCYFWPVHPWENPFALVCSSIKGAKMRPRSQLAPHSQPEAHPGLCSLANTALDLNPHWLMPLCPSSLPRRPHRGLSWGSKQSRPRSPAHAVWLQTNHAVQSIQQNPPPDTWLGNKTAAVLVSPSPSFWKPVTLLTFFSSLSAFFPWPPRNDSFWFFVHFPDFVFLVTRPRSFFFKEVLPARFCS